MWKFLLTGVIAASAIACFPLATQSQSASRQISASQAQGQNQAPLQTLKLWTGYGLSLNFIATGERVQKVWLDDPSQVGMDFDRPLCTASQSTCETGGATVIHLRRIAPVKFPQLLQTEGRTTLKVITQSAEHRRLYQFQLLLTSGQPEYVTVEIVPERGVESGDFEMPPKGRTQFLKTLQAGLIQAERNQQISRQQPLWSRIQHFITLTRNGMATEPAARTAGISLALIQRLTELGQTPSTSQP